MIISASRRTDIPAFHSEWFMDRIKLGCFGEGSNNTNKGSKTIGHFVHPGDTIVFWTKDAQPMLKHLKTLDDMGYNYYFQFTVNGYRKSFEPHVRYLPDIIRTFRELSETIGRDKVIWRYDPIILTSSMDYGYHMRMFYNIMRDLKAYTNRLVVSIIDVYGKVYDRMENTGILLPGVFEKEYFSVLQAISNMANENYLDIYACGEKDYSSIGIKQSHCIDANLIKNLFGTNVDNGKDKTQRKLCGCVNSLDVGTYGTCKHNCIYCYAR